MKSRKSAKGGIKGTAHADSYVMYGAHTVKAALANPNRIVHQLFYTDTLDNQLAALIEERKLKSKSISPHALSTLVGQAHAHQHIAAEVKRLKQPALEDIHQPTKLLMLDQLTDVQNIGAIIRTAAAFGIDAVIQHKQQAPEENAGMAKAAVGTLETMPLIAVSNLSQTLKLLQKDGFWVTGLDGQGDISLPKIEKMDKWVLVLGSEGKGIRDNVKKQCDFVASIPIESEVESLNASNAAAVAIYHLCCRA